LWAGALLARLPLQGVLYFHCGRVCQRDAYLVAVLELEHQVVEGLRICPNGMYPKARQDRHTAIVAKMTLGRRGP